MVNNWNKLQSICKNRGNDEKQIIYGERNGKKDKKVGKKIKEEKSEKGQIMADIEENGEKWPKHFFVVFITLHLPMKET